jgi:cell fate (sporulation/competence/biofilm development) regulator YmcA (YheA/YmcA/DUF963 family)
MSETINNEIKNLQKRIVILKEIRKVLPDVVVTDDGDLTSKLVHKYLNHCEFYDSSGLLVYFSHNREVKNLCKMCLALYYKNLDDECIKIQEALNNRPIRQKFHDWLQELDNLGHSHLDAILYPMAIIMTCGLVIPAKYVAKLLLKAGI